MVKQRVQMFGVHAILIAYSALALGPILWVVMNSFTDWNSVLAALSMAILPAVVIYVIFSRQLISGLTAGAVK
jgi:ABC-type glycerol-3-phosphate transport system permease component